MIQYLRPEAVDIHIDLLTCTLNMKVLQTVEAMYLQPGPKVVITTTLLGLRKVVQKVINTGATLNIT